jgi:hypothetical protein
MNFTLTDNVIHYSITSDGSYSIEEFIPNFQMNGNNKNTKISNNTLDKNDYWLLLQKHDYLLEKLFISYLIH